MRNAIIAGALVALSNAQSTAACIHNTSEQFALSVACDNDARHVSEPRHALLQMTKHQDRTPLHIITKQVRTSTLQLGLDDVFLYDHLPKAGGSFVKGVFSEGKVVPLDRLRIINESQTLSSEDRLRTFTVGSVRNPCDYYVSCWSYFGQLPLKYRVAAGAGPEYYGVSNDLSTSEDLRRFGQWLHYVMPDSRGPGLLTARILWSYFNESVSTAVPPGPNMRGWMEKDRKVYAVAAASLDPASIDCWIKTETLPNDLTNCLMLFEEAAGYDIVNWTEYNTIVERLTAEHDLGIKNGWTKKSSHQPCAFYFNEANTDFVLNADNEIFSKFGYSKCCD